jgi:hypothetical protein
MAKRKDRNIIFIGKDGKIVIASGTGDVTVTTTAKLSGNLTELLKKRQKTDKELIKALADAHYPVDGGTDIDVIDPSGALNELGKKKG